MRLLSAVLVGWLIIAAPALAQPTPNYVKGLSVSSVFKTGDTKGLELGAGDLSKVEACATFGLKSAECLAYGQTGSQPVTITLTADEAKLLAFLLDLKVGELDALRASLTAKVKAAAGQ